MPQAMLDELVEVPDGLNPRKVFVGEGDAKHVLGLHDDLHYIETHAIKLAYAYYCVNGGNTP
jgi:hypothetical protein